MKKMNLILFPLLSIIFLSCASPLPNTERDVASTKDRFQLYNPYFNKRSVFAQLEDLKKHKSVQISTASPGVINESLGCDGFNCRAIKLREGKEYGKYFNLYADVVLQDGEILEGVYIAQFFEGHLIPPENVKLLFEGEKPTIALIPAKGQ